MAHEPHEVLMALVRPLRGMFEPHEIEKMAAKVRIIAEGLHVLGQMQNDG